MDRYLLRYFLAVAELGSFSKAAARVSVTQPTLSVGIAKLEEQVGARLFERTTRRVALTQAGARFLDHARRINQAYEFALRDVANAPAAKPLRVGMLNSIASGDLDRIISLFQASNAGAVLELVDGSERDLTGRLSDGRIDLALTILRPTLEHFDCEKLRRETYMVALPEAHALANEKSVDGRQLTGETMIVRRNCEALPEISRYFTARNVRPQFSYKTTNDDKAMLMVRSGLGITVVPSSFHAPGVRLVRLRGFLASRQIGLVFSRTRNAAEALIQAAKAAYD
jgi:DNA-binding transcriptional LysR family regulator